MIIAEGPDGSGKTTLLNYIASLTGRGIYHPGGPPTSIEELDRRMSRIIELGANALVDRVSIVSEAVYGGITQDGILFDRGFIIHWSEQLKRVGAVMVYCRPSRETLRATVAQGSLEKSHKPREQVDGVWENLDRIIDLYDNVVLDVACIGAFPVLQYNRDTMDRNESVRNILNLERRIIDGQENL